MFMSTSGGYLLTGIYVGIPPFVTLASDITNTNNDNNDRCEEDTMEDAAIDTIKRQRIE